MTFQWGNEWPTLSRPLERAQLRLLSLGAGVQSTTLALAAARGEVGPMPDAALFADTGWEPRAVYQHLAQLRDKLPFPVHVVSTGNLREDALHPSKPEHRYAMPFHVRKPDGTLATGKRQCTNRYKVQAINRAVRELLGKGPRDYIAPGTVEMWIGISTDEYQRMKPARVRYIVNRWPLIEAGMDRPACQRWLAERQERAPRSACRGCPFQSNEDWRAMRDQRPDEWQETIAEDCAIRHLGATRGSLQFMHHSGVPLAEALIDRDEEPDFFLSAGVGADCEGMCGV